jgi:ABC-type transporter Mla subunit MlaD
VLPDAPGLKEGAGVTYRGIQIGSVDGISFSDTSVIVAFHVTRRDAPIGIRDQVRLASLGLLGDKILDIRAGPPSAPRVAAGDTLSAAPLDSLVAVRAAAADTLMASVLQQLGVSSGARDSIRSRRDVPKDSSP